MDQAVGRKEKTRVRGRPAFYHLKTAVLTSTSPTAPARLRRSRKKKFEAEVERAVRTAVAAVEGDTAIILEAQAAKQAEKKKRHPHRQLARSIGDPAALP